VLALLFAAPASAKLTPIRRPVGETTLPRVRAGKIVVSQAHKLGLTRVIVRLAAPPLAVWNSERTLLSTKATQHLNVHSTASRAYVAKLQQAQKVAVAELHAAIPQAQVQERYSILLDGFTVQLPERALAKLEKLAFVTHVYPSLTYYATSDPGPSVIRAEDLSNATGDQGQGMKIAIVDTGVDSSSTYLSAAGFSYPPGFPKGDTKLTTPKVIVAKVFPGPVRDKLSNQPFDPSEPHGTHVAGIAAGDSNTNAPAGVSHPAVSGLTGVAPKAWIGDYRVFTIPTPLGHTADTPEIVQAFEAAVSDGMNVINFSGGGPETEPANDAMFETIHNVSLAGVVPVVAAGNDRDQFGLGTVGSPAVAPDAISVAATSTGENFAPALSVLNGPVNLSDVAITGAGGVKLPAVWATTPEPIIDASTIMGTDHKPVDPYLCGAASDPNGTEGTLPQGSANGLILLAYRGKCSFASKAERAIVAGALGLILIDNRSGYGDEIGVQLPVPTGLITDLDGANLRAYLDAHGGEAQIYVSNGIKDITTNNSGVISYFSSAGPTDFGDDQKPDIAAPGVDVLSSTPPLTTGEPFSVFSGTSMATPHIAGAAALILERHPNWSAAEVKSALMSTAGPAWSDTAATQEASVLLEGAGLANVLAADDPKIFTDPQSLSFEKIDVANGDQRKSLLLSVSDAGDGGGTWTVSLAPQAQTSGVQIETPGSVTLPSGGFMAIPVTVVAPASAGTGENYGFVELTGNGVTRRVPYSFLVERPALAGVAAVPLKKLQTGNTAQGPNRVSQYCCPSEPFGPPATYTGAPMNETGSEHLYYKDINEPVVNWGVSIWAETAGAVVDPFVLGSKDENDVEGYAGIPTDVNDLTFDANLDVGAAGASFPRLQRFYVSVDSGTDEFTGASEKGQYLLNSWVNDLTPPATVILTKRVTAGRPLIVAGALDAQSGVDPLSLTIGYKGALVGASQYDPTSGLTVFGIPDTAPALKPGKVAVTFQASDYQEAKNINTVGDALMPNTSFLTKDITVVDGPTVSWIGPPANACALKHDQLTVIADSTKKVKDVVFTENGKRIGVDKGSLVQVYSHTWNTTKLKKGKHLVVATVEDAAGRKASSGRIIRICQ